MRLPNRRWLVAATALAASCASLSTPGDRYFEAGDFVPAAAAYEAILEGEEALDAREQRALFRLGLTHVIPESPLRDPARAAEIFGRLIDEHPEGAYAIQARLILGLESDSQRLRRAVGETEAELVELSSELARAVGESESMDAEIVSLEETIDQLRQRIRRLEAELAHREQELEQLKKIDLE